MRQILIQGSLIISVAMAYLLAWSVDPFLWRLAAVIGANFVLTALFIPRYPRAAALKETLKLPKGTIVEVESK